VGAHRERHRLSFCTFFPHHPRHRCCEGGGEKGAFPATSLHLLGNLPTFVASRLGGFVLVPSHPRWLVTCFYPCRQGRTCRAPKTPFAQAIGRSLEGTTLLTRGPLSRNQRTCRSFPPGRDATLPSLPVSLRFVPLDAPCPCGKRVSRQTCGRSPSSPRRNTGHPPAVHRF
jgi:hypothetical protein